MTTSSPTYRFLAAAIIALVAVACAKEPVPVEPADLLFVNAGVYTLDWNDPDPTGAPSNTAAADMMGGWAPNREAIAVRGDRIVFVGSSAEAYAYRGDSTRVIDLRGRFVVPGLIDSHVHIAELGGRLERVDLTGVRDETEAVQRVSARAASTPKGEWIVGQGWDEGAWANNLPNMALLSTAVPDHPVILRSLHTYAVWGNKLAFERARITADTPAPPGGEILRDSSGAPTGVLLNTAGDLLQRALPRPTLDQMKTRIVNGLGAVGMAGFVEVHEAGADSLEMAALEALAADGKLPIRVYAMLSARDPRLLDRWLARGPDTSGADNLVVRSVKAFYDGALGSRGARLLQDYSDTPGHRGMTAGYGFDTARVAKMMRAGFQVAIHAIGDAANRDALTFFERVMKSDSTAGRTRPRIEHAQVVQPNDFARFAAMDIIASMQPSHAVEDMAWAEERIGPERIQGAYAWRVLRELGVPMTFNSDLPGTDHDFFYSIHSATTRRDKSKLPPNGWYPEQILMPEEAVRGFTSWAAYAGFEEKETGTIAVGKRADLTVLDADPFHLAVTSPGSLLGKKIAMTVAAGRVVYTTNLRSSPRR